MAAAADDVPQKVSAGWVKARRDLWEYLLGLAKGVYGAGLAPSSHDSPQQTAVVMMAGVLSWGFDEMQALRLVHIVQGKAELSAEGQVAIVRRERAGTFECEQGEDCCKVTGIRADSGETYTAEWTMERAREAGLTRKSVWKNHPGTMLRHRCESEVCNALFSDLVGGTYTPEEMQEVRDARQRPADASARVDAMMPDTEPEQLPSPEEYDEQETVPDPVTEDRSPSDASAETPAATDAKAGSAHPDSSAEALLNLWEEYPEACRAVFKDESLQKGDLGEPDEAPDGLWEDVLAKVKAQIEEEDGE